MATTRGRRAQASQLTNVLFWKNKKNKHWLHTMNPEEELKLNSNMCSLEDQQCVLMKHWLIAALVNNKLWFLVHFYFGKVNVVEVGQPAAWIHEFAQHEYYEVYL